MIYVIDDATSLEQNKIFEEEFDNTELESIPATVPHFNPEGYHHSKYEKDIPCQTFVFDMDQDKFVKNIEVFAPVIRAMIPTLGDVNVVASRFNLVNQPSSKNHTPFHRDFLNDHWVGVYYINDAVGDTIVFDDGEAKYTSPKRDRLLFFPGQFHAIDLLKEIDNRKVYNFAFTTKNP